MSSKPADGLPFVGRKEELKELDHHLKQALKGEGSIVFLSGEAGIGKTRLAQEFVRRAKGMGLRHLSAKCMSGPGSPLYAPWIECIRTILRASFGAAILPGLRVKH